jgi:hypothetical protein
MLHIVEAGTDGAMLSFFDPAALPQDFDKRIEDDTIATFEQLAKEGRFWWKSTGGDGGYLFHFYVDSEVPERILEFAKDAEEIPEFLVPSGTLWACGAEYAAKEPMQGNRNTPRGGLGKYKHMGSKLDIQPGKYILNAWRTEWAEGTIQQRLETSIGKGAIRRLTILGQFTGLFFVGLLVVTIIGVVFTVSGKIKTVLLFWGIMFLLWFVCFRLFRVITHCENSTGKHEIEREFPSIVVRMRRIP